MLINLIVDLIIGAVSGWLITTLMHMDSSNMIFNCCLGLFGRNCRRIPGRTARARCQRPDRQYHLLSPRRLPGSMGLPQMD